MVVSFSRAVTLTPAPCRRFEGSSGLKSNQWREIVGPAIGDSSRLSRLIETSNSSCERGDAAVCLRARIIASLEDQGIALSDRRTSLDFNNDKEALRRLHHVAVQHAIDRSRPGLERHQETLLRRIASGSEVNPTSIRPTLVEVVAGTEDELLFRFAKLHWSVPVSAGYGRRLRFLVIDESTSKLMGLIGLGDPVYALGPRDQWAGWDTDAKRTRIGCVMDAFVLGAIPPYNMLLGSKLVALAACSQEVIEAFQEKYATRRSLIANQQPIAGLALITTTSALGRSSVYNRLRMGNNKIFRSVGFTKGSGEFQFANDLYKDLLQFVREHSAPSAKHADWGTGFRSKREVVLKALSILGLPQALIYHGVRREVFVAPLATNTREFLSGRDPDLSRESRSMREIAEFFHDRWLLPRASWDHRYTSFRADSYALWKR
ncbi:MAG: Druantia anti-phage system protein DruA [Candidatus Binatia bacterium]